MGTLSLPKKKAAPASAAPAELPVYDPRKCSALVGGVGLVQGKYAFSDRAPYRFIKEVPKEQWYVLSPEQEQNYARQMAKQKQTFRQQVDSVPSMPQKLMEMARENAQALAAENFAE